MEEYFIFGDRWLQVETGKTWNRVTNRSSIYFVASRREDYWTRLTSMEMDCRGQKLMSQHQWNRFAYMWNRHVIDFFRSYIFEAYPNVMNKLDASKWRCSSYSWTERTASYPSQNVRFDATLSWMDWTSRQIEWNTVRHCVSPGFIRCSKPTSFCNKSNDFTVNDVCEREETTSTYNRLKLVLIDLRVYTVNVQRFPWLHIE